VYFAIEAKPDAVHIGNVWLWGIDWHYPSLFLLAVPINHAYYTAARAFDPSICLNSISDYPMGTIKSMLDMFHAQHHLFTMV
jgi:hypothetical protein